MTNGERDRANDSVPPGEARDTRERLRVVLLSGFVGVLAGLVGAAFHHLLDSVPAAREALRTALSAQSLPDWIVFVVLGAVAVAICAELVTRLAPEASGSGIQEVEGVLAGERILRWGRILPIKFIGGVLGIGSGLVLGREGPTVHMGSALGGFVAERLRLPVHHAKTLIAAGSGAGLAAAFNAPLAGIIFITEEMRSQFNYNFTSLHAVIAASCMSVVVNDLWLGQGPSLPVQNVPYTPILDLPLFLSLGVLIGAIGVGFNRILLGTLGWLGPIRLRHSWAVGGLIGGLGGALLSFAPNVVGGGDSLVEELMTREWPFVFLLGLLCARFLTTAGSYGSGTPGGIFAPLLALGTLSGIAFGSVVEGMFPNVALPPGTFAVAGMGALFAATVDAPLTGIVLVIELTSAHDALLTIIVTCLSATLTARALGGRAIYGQLLELAKRSLPEISAP